MINNNKISITLTEHILIYKSKMNIFSDLDNITMVKMEQYLHQLYSFHTKKSYKIHCMYSCDQIIKTNTDFDLFWSIFFFNLPMPWRHYRLCPNSIFSDVFMIFLPYLFYFYSTSIFYSHSKNYICPYYLNNRGIIYIIFQIIQHVLIKTTFKHIKKILKTQTLGK